MTTPVPALALYVRHVAPAPTLGPAHRSRSYSTTANWNAGSSNRWTLPLGGGVGKLFKIGNQAMNAKLQFYGNAVKPDNAPKWLMRFTFQFLFPK